MLILIEKHCLEGHFKFSKSHLIGPRNFCFQIGHVSYQKIRIFALISKIKTYLYDKMHLKGEILKKQK